LADFADKNPKTVKAVLKALHEASIWLDDLGNRPEQAEIVSRPTYINCPKEIILAASWATTDFGDGRTKKDDHYMIYHQRNCNYPQPKYAVWWLTQFRRWGDGEWRARLWGCSKAGMRGDIYEQAMKEIGTSMAGQQ